MQSSAVSRNAAALIATVAAGAAVYWLRDILTPLAMALFLLIMIDGVKRTVAARTPLNDRWAGVAALVLVVLAFFASIGIIVNGAAGFFGEASGVSQNIGPRIDQIIRDVYGMARLNNPPTAQELINGVDIRGYVASIAIQAQGIASGAFFVMVYLGFLLASQIGFRRKIVTMFPQKAPARRSDRSVRTGSRRGRGLYLGPDRHRRHDLRRGLDPDARGGASERRVLDLRHLHRRLHSRAGRGRGGTGAPCSPWCNSPATGRP